MKPSFCLTTLGLSLTCVFLLTTNVSGQNDKPTEQTTTPNPVTSEPDPGQSVLLQWVEFTRSATGSVESLIRKALPMVSGMGSIGDLSTKCTSSLLKLVFGVKGMKSWAIRMLDASGRPPAGILDGTLSDLGSIDECFDIDYKDEYSGKDIFKGQHCSINIVPVLPPKPRQVTFKSTVIDLSNYTSPDSVFVDFARKAPFFYRIKFRIGVCVPSTCSKEDVQIIVKEALKDTFLNATVPYCQVKEGWEISTLQISILASLGTIFILVGIGTVVNRIFKDPGTNKNEEERLLLRVFRCFSLDKNYSTLMESDPGAKLDVLDGIRVLSMLWIILVHTYAFQHDKAIGKIMEIINFTEYVSFGVVVNAWISVDSFFVVGGILVAYTTLRSLERNNGSFGVIRYIFRRVWRLSPCLFLAMGLLFLLPLIDRGPNWPETIGLEVKRCYDLWWGSLFYVNSWMDFNENCMIHTWYVSADMCLYLLAGLPIYLLYRWPRLGVAVCFSLIATSIGIVGAVTYVLGLYPTILYLSPDMEHMANVGRIIYLRPYTHMAPYMVGVLVGYKLIKDKKGQMHLITSILGWIASLGVLMAVLLGAFHWHNGINALPYEAALYGSLHRPLWAAGLGWIVYACSTGRGGFVRTFLSWSVFRRLSSLTYLMYLIHMPAIWQRNGSRRERFYLRHYDMIYEFFGNVLLSMTLAFVLHLFVEAPFSSLDKVLFPSDKKCTSTTPDSDSSPSRNEKSLNGNGLSSMTSYERDAKSRSGAHCQSSHILESTSQHLRKRTTLRILSPSPTPSP